MGWMKDGRPDFGAAGPQRLIVGLAWGLLLLALDPLGERGIHSLTYYLMLWPGLVVPFVLLAGLGEMRRVTLAAWAATAAGLAVLLVWHDIARQGASPAQPSPLLIPMSAVFFFGLHQLVATGDEARRWIAPYDRLFGHASRQAVQLVLSVAITGLFWAVLGLGAALFTLIGVKAFGEFIAHNWFRYPATTLVFALAVQISDVRAGLIDGIRVLGLNLLAWLGPLLTLLCLAFLLLLPMTGLGPLWATKAATPILLAAAVVLIGLINAAYQDGRREPEPAWLLRLSARVAGLLVVPLVVLAGYATLLRVGQYGLTPDRVIALAVILVTGLVALGCALAAVLPGAWMKRLELTNIAGLILALAVLLALFTPLADPARLSVDSQMARLTRGLTPPEKFDYGFLAAGGQRYGQAALAALKRRADHIGELARNSDPPDKPSPPPPAVISPRYVVYPKGAVLPADFLATRWRSDLWTSPNCEDAKGRPCEAFLVDLDGDGTQEILLQAPPDGSITMRVQAYRREPGGWRYLAEARTTLCEADLSVLRSGGAETAPSELRDLVVNKRHIGFDTRGSTCDAKPRPEDNPGGVQPDNR